MKRMTIAGGLGALALLSQLMSLAQPGEAKARQGVSVQQQAHPRLLPLEGGQNFRDLGGYRTRDGRTVRWGMLFRSGAMDRLTAADYAYLGKIGIRTVCDFRRARNAPPRRCTGLMDPCRRCWLTTIVWKAKQGFLTTQTS